MSVQNKKFGEIDVERINIVDKNGTLRMAISNKDHFPPPMVIEGEPVPRDTLPLAGILFYNDEGIECGGLTFASRKDENGEVEQQALLSFDPYLQNDIIDLGIHEKNGKREMSLEMWDRPDSSIMDIVEKWLEFKDSPQKLKEYREELHKSGGIGHRRILIEKSREGEATICLSDSKGQPRIRIMVDANDIPRLEFLDNIGEVVYCLPPKK